MKKFINYQPNYFLFLITLLLITLLGCGSDDENNASGPSVVYMWRATSMTDGDLGGVSGANSICETDSASISFATSVNNHLAVIATSSNAPKGYLGNNPSVKRPDGTDIISTYSAFFDNAATATNSNIGIGWYWTGLDNNGDASTNNCNNWTSASSSNNGGLGDGSTTNANRILRGVDGCNNGHLLLCISY